MDMDMDQTHRPIRRTPPRDADARPVCPQFRIDPRATAYPIRGYCTPVFRRTGWLVIPSIDGDGLSCLEDDFAHCPWFRGGASRAEGKTFPRARAGGGPACRTDG